MNNILKQLEKVAERSNGQIRVVDVPKDRIPNYEGLIKIDTEVLSQVGMRNISCKNIDSTNKTLTKRR